MALSKKTGTTGTAETTRKAGATRIRTMKAKTPRTPAATTPPPTTTRPVIMIHGRAAVSSIESIPSQRQWPEPRNNTQGRGKHC